MHLIKGAVFTTFVREGIKPKAEWNRSNCSIIWTRTPDMLRKIGVDMPGLSMDGELISRPVLATKADKHPADSIEPHQAYETF